MTDDPGPAPVVLADVGFAGVGRLRLNRPDVANALDQQVADGIRAAVRRFADDSSVTAVLVSGQGPRFCAGGDMSHLASAGDDAASLRAAAQDLADAVDAACRELSELAKPVVVVVHGVVAGAGLALMLSCDVVVAARSTRFTPAYPRVGLNPDCGLTWLLPRAVGSVRALDILLTNRMLTAPEALDIGLVARMVDDDAAYDVAAGLTAGLAAGPAIALGHTKRLARTAWDTDRAAHGVAEAAALAESAVADPARDAIARFRR